MLDEERVQHLYTSFPNMYETIIDWFQSQSAAYPKPTTTLKNNWKSMTV